MTVKQKKEYLLPLACIQELGMVGIICSSNVNSLAFGSDNLAGTIDNNNYYDGGSF